jgi:2-oxoglutarate ferredoxin oxidoreductase subunit beta
MFHGVVHKVVAEVIKGIRLQEKTIGVAPVGCAVFAINISISTGRKQPTGVLPRWHGCKRLLPDRMVFITR